MTIGIVVADDHEVVRAGFAALLDTQPDFTVLGTASDGSEAVRVCHDYRDERGPRCVTGQLRDERYHVTLTVDHAGGWQVDLTLWLHDLHSVAATL